MRVLFLAREFQLEFHHLYIYKYLTSSEEATRPDCIDLIVGCCQMGQARMQTYEQAVQDLQACMHEFDADPNVARVGGDMIYCHVDTSTNFTAGKECRAYRFKQSVGVIQASRGCRAEG